MRFAYRVYVASDCDLPTDSALSRAEERGIICLPTQLCGLCTGYTLSYKAEKNGALPKWQGRPCARAMLILPNLSAGVLTACQSTLPDAALIEREHK